MVVSCLVCRHPSEAALEIARCSQLQSTRRSVNAIACMCVFTIAQVKFAWLIVLNSDPHGICVGSKEVAHVITDCAQAVCTFVCEDEHSPRIVQPPRIVLPDGTTVPTEMFEVKCYSTQGGYGAAAPRVSRTEEEGTGTKCAEAHKAEECVWTNCV